jgi:excisionase family DNA binding protein
MKVWGFYQQQRAFQSSRIGNFLLQNQFFLTDFLRIAFYAYSIATLRSLLMSKVEIPDTQYLSTRQSAKILQVSLGTVQKMVELGELAAWKTRGGHRRILYSSLEQQLQRRRFSAEQRSKKQCLTLGIFKRIENYHELKERSEAWQLRIQLVHSMDTLEALMQAVSIAPDLIYLDALIPPIEQVHLIHYLSKNKVTQKIPILIDQSFIDLHPKVIQLAGENCGVLSQVGEMNDAQNQIALEQNRMIIAYPSHYRFSKLEKLFYKALGRPFEEIEEMPNTQNTQMV